MRNKIDKLYNSKIFIIMSTIVCSLLALPIVTGYIFYKCSGLVALTYYSVISIIFLCHFLIMLGRIITQIFGEHTREK